MDTAEALREMRRYEIPSLSSDTSVTDTSYSSMAAVRQLDKQLVHLAAVGRVGAINTAQACQTGTRTQAAAYIRQVVLPWYLDGGEGIIEALEALRKTTFSHAVKVDIHLRSGRRQIPGTAGTPISPSRAVERFRPSVDAFLE
jgi:hypothetical protein